MRANEFTTSKAVISESLLDRTRRMQIIHFLAKKLDWEVNYLELATDHELIKWYKAVQRGEKPMEGVVDPELAQTKRFAKTHYQNIDPAQAWEKYVQRSLLHAKQADASEDARLDRIEAQLKQLTAMSEAGKASVTLCKSSTPDEDLGASQLASCKSQGLRARDGNKSHKLGKSKKSRVKVGGHKIKGQKYGGPLPDWS